MRLAAVCFVIATVAATSEDALQVQSPSPTPDILIEYSSGSYGNLSIVPFFSSAITRVTQDGHIIRCEWNDDCRFAQISPPELAHLQSMLAKNPLLKKTQFLPSKGSSMGEHGGIFYVRYVRDGQETFVATFATPSTGPILDLVKTIAGYWPKQSEPFQPPEGWRDTQRLESVLYELRWNWDEQERERELNISCVFFSSPRLTTGTAWSFPLLKGYEFHLSPDWDVSVSASKVPALNLFVSRGDEPTPRLAMKKGLVFGASLRDISLSPTFRFAMNSEDLKRGRARGTLDLWLTDLQTPSGMTLKTFDPTRSEAFSWIEFRASACFPR